MWSSVAKLVLIIFWKSPHVTQYMCWNSWTKGYLIAISIISKIHDCHLLLCKEYAKASVFTTIRNIFLVTCTAKKKLLWCTLKKVPINDFCHQTASRKPTRWSRSPSSYCNTCCGFKEKTNCKSATLGLKTQYFNIYVCLTSCVLGSERYGSSQLSRLENQKRSSTECRDANWMEAAQKD